MENLSLAKLTVMFSVTAPGADLQKRGLAHLHGVLEVSTPAKRTWAEAYVGALRDLAPAKGFGFVDGWHNVGRKFWPGVQAGMYLSSYLAGGKLSGKTAITETVRSADLPKLMVFVGRDLTAISLCTMRNLRNVRRLWAWRRGYMPRILFPRAA
jgi:hypothetical protein